MLFVAIFLSSFFPTISLHQIAQYPLSHTEQAVAECTSIPSQNNQSPPQLVGSIPQTPTLVTQVFGFGAGNQTSKLYLPILATRETLSAVGCRFKLHPQSRNKGTLYRFGLNRCSVQIFSSFYAYIRIRLQNIQICQIQYATSIKECPSLHQKSLKIEKVCQPSKAQKNQTHSAPVNTSISERKK